MAKRAKDLVKGKMAGSNQRRRGRPKLRAEKTLIVCEGKVTEISYFQDMARAYKLAGTDVKVCSGRKSNPSTVLQTAIDIYNERRDYEKVYLVVDVDEHQKDLDIAFKKLADYRFGKIRLEDSKYKTPEVRILVSNPCIEVWFILHYELLRKPFIKNHLSKAQNCKKHLSDNHIANYTESTKGLFQRLKEIESQAHTHLEKLRTMNKQEQLSEPDTQLDVLCMHLKSMKRFDS